MPHRLRLTLLILAAAAVYLVGNDRVPLWDRDEPRNAQAARQMYQTGDWVVPRFLDKVRTAKPVFTYWCQATAMHVLGDNTFAARLPSGIAMTLTLIVLAGVLSRYVDHERAFWAVFILATSAMVMAWTAKTSLTDSVLLLWIVIAELCFFELLRGNATWRVVMVMSVAIGLAGLTKGPVVLGILGMTLLALAAMNWRKLFYSEKGGLGVILQTVDAVASSVLSDNADVNGRGPGVELKISVGVAIIAAIVGPWLYLVEHRAPGFILTTASRDVVQRIFEPLEQHKGPPGYYLLVLWGIYFPWSVLLPLTFVLAWRNRRDPLVRFALAAVIGPWVMFECVQTKLPHYALPIFPPLAFLTADAIVRCLDGEYGDLLTPGTRIAIAIWASIVAALAIALVWFGTGQTPLAAVIGGVGIVYAIVVFALFARRQPRCGLLAMGGGVIAIMALLFGLFVPRLGSLRLSPRIAEILKQNGGDASATKAGDVQMIAYKEPSLAFYQGGTIREQSENDFLITHPLAQWPKFVVIREDVWKQMPADVKNNLDVLGEVRGLDLPDRGRTWTVIVARRR